ncbi:hypothetical protein GGS20DRAFT_594063 [Poronia punctata]|nr:hypothetical protein GGS20DRAFT_594063 [Poronia punctata]
MDSAGTRYIGGRLLGEVDEESLEELLKSFRSDLLGGWSSNNPHRRSPHIPLSALSDIIDRYQRATQAAPPPLFSASGRYLPLLYHFVSILVAHPYSYTVVIIDAERRFDVTRLVSPRAGDSSGCPAKASDLQHVHVYRSAHGQRHVKAALEAAHDFMLYGDHESRNRAWWGTVVVGGVGGHVNAGWQGWLRVESEEVIGFGPGISVDEALKEGREKEKALDSSSWVAFSRWGAYMFKNK